MTDKLIRTITGQYAKDVAEALAHPKPSKRRKRTNKEARVIYQLEHRATVVKGES